jgi:hypothetical protein
MTHFHDLIGGQPILREGDAANIVTQWIRQRVRAWLPTAVKLDQQLGKSLNKGLAADACQHARNKAIEAPTVLS